MVDQIWEEETQASSDAESSEDLDKKEMTGKFVTPLIVQNEIPEEEKDQMNGQQTERTHQRLVSNPFYENLMDDELDD